MLDTLTEMKEVTTVLDMLGILPQMLELLRFHNQSK